MSAGWSSVVPVCRFPIRAPSKDGAMPICRAFAELAWKLHSRPEPRAFPPRHGPPPPPPPPLRGGGEGNEQRFAFEQRWEPPPPASEASGGEGTGGGPCRRESENRLPEW